jgi:S-adenosylmethionine decarboxylase
VNPLPGFVYPAVSFFREVKTPKFTGIGGGITSSGLARLDPRHHQSRRTIPPKGTLRVSGMRRAGTSTGWEGVMSKSVAFTDLGIVSDTQPSRTNSEHAEVATAKNENTYEDPKIVPLPARLADYDQEDHFVERDGMLFAGTHLIIDLWGASRLDDINHIEDTLREAIREAGATLLHIHLHHFTPNGGVSGVAVLAESHISIHTWPERDYAALDVFMCGDALPHRTIPVLKRAFAPESVQIGDHKRGVIA